MERRMHLPMPIIVGSARSGTTLLRLMLDAHPELAIPPETGFLTLDAPAASADQVGAFLHSVTHYPPDAPAWADFQISSDAFEAQLRKLRPFSAAEGFRAFYRLYAARFSKPRWGDKTPLYRRSMLRIERLLPEARFIHVLRDGRDAAVSLRRQWFSPGHDVATQARFWRDNVLEARRQGAACRHYVEVRLEDLVQRPEQVLRPLCDFCELPWSAELLRHHEQAPHRLREHTERRAHDGRLILSQEERLRQQAASVQPPDAARLGVWRTQLTREECRQFEALAGDLLVDLGYPVLRDELGAVG